MKINEITIKNFRGFEDFHAELNPDLTVFIGNNGSGKSTVLDAISIGTFFSGLDGVPGTGINKEDVTCKSFDMGTVIDLQHQYPSVITAKGEVGGEVMEWSRSLNGASGRTTTIDANSILTAVMDAHHRPAEVQAMFDRFYLTVEEDFSQAEAILNEIEALIGSEDPELTQARVTLALEQL